MNEHPKYPYSDDLRARGSQDNYTKKLAEAFKSAASPY